MVTVSDIRARFLEYFADAGHKVVPSSPLVPHNDPTLLFTNAGMVQFKNVFTGLEKRDYNRAATAQKCVRAGGKHNDLDNVGYTARHHTFFEMLGNFSFGDYFKEQAIELAWNLVTKDFGLAKDKLCVTVYHTDDEAFSLWQKIAGLPEDKIIRIPTSDNFWAMGDTGPCGPCSEIFYDHGPEIPGGPPGSPDADGDRFIEIWNLVFMQYDQAPGGVRTPLPKPSIDTGMGLERIAAVLQGVHDNYDTDLFRTLIRASVEASGHGEEGEARVSHRVIADHLRSSCFLMADGVLPSNEGRGYVLRRIMRRAMRHAHQLGCRDALLYKLVPTLVQAMGQAYPELGRAQALMTDTLRIEEERFKQTLERGLKLLEEEAAGVTGRFPGETAFKLYDTYGFPIDLTADVLRTKGLEVDMAAFDAAMQRQKEEARKHWAGSGEKSDNRLWFELREQHGATEFLGYTRETSEGIVQAIVKDGAAVTEAKAGDTIQFITNQTPFYAESGGQTGDTGTARSGKAAIRITDTQKAAGELHVHLGVVDTGTVAVGDSLELDVDHERRAAIRGAHSATHLVHNALRRLLGHHVAQKGSLVTPGRFRFDFSNPKSLTREELVQLENEVNRLIRQNSEVRTQLLPQEDAIKAGAIAMFGEKYGDEVRVISMGMDGFDYYSVELCGGTHVYETGDIGLFKIIGESSVAAGVRRIEALTGQEALNYVRELEESVATASAALKVPVAEVPARISALLDEKKRLEKEIADLRRNAALGGGGGGAAKPEIEEIGGIRFIARTLSEVPAKDLKGVADELKKQIGSGVVAVLSSHEGKAGAVVAVTPDKTAVVNAVDLAKLAASALGGTGGGGRPDMAQSGGPDTTKIPEAVAAIRSQLQQLKSAA